ncbi:ABC transporter permease [Lactococcus nasutitermitis]|uniref:ABC transporter permease n=1 Tax=Lactococcus nasutitermitis TaxID=1652957 RepID=A0ABV9JD29_9LACT|nr:ABC transporter permease subunit [Lactococcus nasutitermitis]
MINSEKLSQQTKGLGIVRKKLDYPIFRTYFASLAIAISLALQLFLPKANANFTKPLPWYTDLLWFSLVITLLLATFYSFLGKFKNFAYKSYFIGAAYLALALYNYATLQTAFLQPVFFPDPAKILNVLITNWNFLLLCLGYSGGLLFSGLILGIVTGLITGVLIGWWTQWNYWIDPIVKFFGPIPSTALIPIALSAFATSFEASVFIIALSVWFPVTVLTNSGISNVKKSYFEVADTMGASNAQKIFRVAIPAASPSIFVGIFNGVCASFLTLMTAEMIGVKYGIGWYINWQRQVMAFANVYAGLIVIAISFSIIITLLFKVRNHILKWQEGVIKW